jgi:fatty-acyl-CoA synthase
MASFGGSGVSCADSHMQLKNRPKRIIISGGENISSIEAEGLPFKHPAVQRIAVAVRPDCECGERRRALIELKRGERSRIGQAN